MIGPIEPNHFDKWLSSLFALLRVQGKAFESEFAKFHKESMVASGPEYDHPKTLELLKENPIRGLFATKHTFDHYEAFLKLLNKAVKYPALHAQALDLARILVRNLPAAHLTEAQQERLQFDKTYRDQTLLSLKKSWFLTQILERCASNLEAMLNLISFNEFVLEQMYLQPLRNLLASPMLGNMPDSLALKQAIKSVCTLLSKEVLEEWHFDITETTRSLIPSRQLVWAPVLNSGFLASQKQMFNLVGGSLLKAHTTILEESNHLLENTPESTRKRALDSGLLVWNSKHELQMNPQVEQLFVKLSAPFIFLSDTTVMLRKPITIFQNFQSKSSKESLIETLRDLLRIKPLMKESATKREAFKNRAIVLQAILQNPENRRFLRQILRNSMKSSSKNRLTFNMASELFGQDLHNVLGQCVFAALLPDQTDLSKWQLVSEEDFAFSELVAQSTLARLNSMKDLIDVARRKMPELAVHGTQNERSFEEDLVSVMTGWRSAMMKYNYFQGCRKDPTLLTSHAKQAAQDWKELTGPLQKLDIRATAWASRFQSAKAPDIFREISAFAAVRELVVLARQLADASSRLYTELSKREQMRRENLRKRKSAKRKNREKRDLARQKEEARLRQIAEEEERLADAKARARSAAENEFMSASVPHKLEQIQTLQAALPKKEDEMHHANSLAALFDRLKIVDPMKWSEEQRKREEKRTKQAEPEIHPESERSVDEMPVKVIQDAAEKLEPEFYEFAPDLYEFSVNEHIIDYHYHAWLDQMYLTFQANWSYHLENEHRLRDDAQRFMAIAMGVDNHPEVWLHGYQNHVPSPSQHEALFMCQFTLDLALGAFYQAQYWSQQCHMMLQEIERNRQLEASTIPSGKIAMDPALIIPDQKLESVSAASHFHVFNWRSMAA